MVSLVRRLDATEARRKFSDILNSVCFGNETVVVTRHGRDIAAVVPMQQAIPPNGESKKPVSPPGQTPRERKRA